MHNSCMFNLVCRTVHVIAKNSVSIAFENNYLFAHDHKNLPIAKCNTVFQHRSHIYQHFRECMPVTTVNSIQWGYKVHGQIVG